MGFIAQQTITNALVVTGNHCRRCIYQLRLYTQLLSKYFVDSIPRKPFIRSNMKDIIDSFFVTKQTHQAYSKIFVMCQGPHRGSIAVNDHRQTLQHTVQNSITAFEWYQRLAVSMRRTHNSIRETIFCVIFAQ